MKVCRVGAELIHAEGWMGRQINRYGAFQDLHKSTYNGEGSKNTQQMSP